MVRESQFKTIEAMKNEIINECYNLEEEIVINNIYFSGVKKDEEGYINFIRRIVIKPDNLNFKPVMIKRIVRSYITNYSELLLSI